MRRLLILLCALMLAAPATAQDEDPYYPEPTPQPYGYGTFIFSNWTAFDVDFIVDGVTACRAYVNSTCTTQSAPGRHYVTGRLVRDPPGETSISLDLEDGATVTWSVEGGGTAPVPGTADPAAPQGTGYGTVTFINQTAFQIDFYIDSSYACRAWVNGSCSAQASVGSHYVSGKTVEDTPRESTGSVEVADGGETSWTLSGGGTPATSGSDSEATGYGTIEIKNYSAFQLDGYVDGVYLCRAAPGSSCSGQASAGTHSVMVRTVEATPRESPPTSLEVAGGGTSTVEYSGGGNAATGYGTIEFKNGTAFPLDGYVDGTYACRAEATSSCAVQASVGTYSVTVRTVEATPRESAAASIEVVEGGTSSVDFTGGGTAPTGNGNIEFFNGTAFSLDFYVDGTFACRANPRSSCTAQASVGTHSVTARTDEATPRESGAGTAEIVDGGTTKFEIGGGGEPVTLTGQGTVMFDNQSMYIIDFYIDGLAACRAQAANSCAAEATVGKHKITGRTVGEPSFEVAGLVDVSEGAQTVYAVVNAAGAQQTQPAPSPVTPSGPAPAPAGSGNVAFENLTKMTVDFYIDGHFLCRAPAQQSCIGVVPPGGGTSVTIRPAA